MLRFSKRRNLGINLGYIYSKLYETKNNSKYLIGYLDDVIRSMILILPKMSRYITTSKNKDRNKDKNKNIKLMSLCI